MAKTATGNLSLSQELRALDGKNRQFRQNLTDDERKKFSPYLMLRYSASVEGSADLQAYYLLATNENVNKYFFDLDSELQWLTCTTVSPGLGSQRHYWHAPPSRNAGDRYWNKLVKLVADLRPDWKATDVAIWCKVNGPQLVEQWILEHGKELPKKS